MNIPYEKKKRKTVTPRRQDPACLPCRKRRIRCVGQDTPCKTCIARGIEKRCEFTSEKKRCPEKMAPHEISTAFDINGPLRICNEPSDTARSPSTSSTVTTLSELSHTPSVDFSDSEENIDTNQTPDGVTFKQPLEALPSWEMIDRLKARYFECVFPVSFFILRSGAY